MIFRKPAIKTVTKWGGTVAIVVYPPPRNKQKPSVVQFVSECKRWHAVERRIGVWRVISKYLQRSEMTQWLESELTDRKVRGSDPTSQLGGNPALVLPPRGTERVLQLNDLFFYNR
ncbi:hypothetical protein CSKR_107869 [Clonorchis sinensis]|uniref:Uncharacterized protein n=1 Tax=Clonorchis sinensis TaxID=79923 RepID=A0A419PVS8_CLOSI|nr:hypothetical protein CSKR_107869 [Clonorchis sinensis]